MDKSKMILALALVAVFVGSAVGLSLIEDDADAVSSDGFIPKHPHVSQVKTEQKVSAESSEKTTEVISYKVSQIHLKITEASIDQGDKFLENKGEWFYWITDSLPAIDGKALSLEAIAPSSGSNTITLSIAGAGTPGFFDITFDDSKYDGKKAVFNIAYKLTTTVVPKTTPTEVASTAPSISQVIYYKIIVEYGTAVTIQESVGSGVTSTVTLGQKITDIQLKVANDTITGTWYAYGLPAGLAMNATGKISGVPAALTGSSGVDVKIYVTDFSGNVHTGTYNIKVSGESQLKITDHSKNVTYIGKDSLNNKNLNRYMMYTGEEASFEVTCDSVKDQKLEVQVIQADGTEGIAKVTHSPDSNVYSFVVTPTGTGDYTIIITDQTKTAMFTILVLNKVQDITADIFFDLQP